MINVPPGIGNVLPASNVLSTRGLRGNHDFQLRNMPNNPEQVLKRSICQWLSYKKCLFWIQPTVGIYDPVRRIYRKNNSPYALRGVSDILGVCKGRFFAIETKVYQNKPTDEQKRFIECVNSHGGLAFVAYRLEDVVQAFKIFD